MTTFIGRTHPGNRGGANEDAMGWDDDRMLGFVADGMGGHARGEVASRLVHDTLLESAGKLDLESAVLLAHEKIFAANQNNTELGRMGSTVVAVQIAKRSCKAVWVGDSRAYLWREGKLIGLTRDHSALEELRDSEGLSETELRVHVNRNVVTQSLGLNAPFPSVTDTPLHTGDWILLCSDGLSSELRDREIADVLSADPALDHAADGLIASALAHGGHDNVSVVLIEYDGAAKKTWALGNSETAVAWLSAAVGVVLAILIAGAWFLFKGRL
jgi:PPM family protein phosphatase